MKLIIPMAGKGTRLRPHTHTRSKPLLHVAGKAVITHILERYKSMKFDEAIFIISEQQEDIKKFITKQFPFKATFVIQKEMRGNGHAVFLAREYVKDTDDIIVVFADTICNWDTKIIKQVAAGKIQADGIIWTHDVDHPEAFGVVIMDGKYAAKIVEKPSTPISNKAIVGMHYFKTAKPLFDALQYLISNEIMTKGEFYLADAVQLLIDNHNKFLIEPSDLWLDCGTSETLISSNAALLKGHHEVKSRPQNSIILSPVYIEKNVIIKNAIIGPNVSIAAGAVIENSIIKESIINELAVINDATIAASIIGNKAVVKGSMPSLNIGDNSEVSFGQNEE